MSGVTIYEQKVTEIVTKNGIAEGAESLKAAYLPHFEAMRESAEKAISITETQPKAARAVRLELRAIRIAADKTRKSLKEDSLRRGKAIDGIYNLLEFQLSPVEEAMEKIEKAEELREAARIAALKELREKEWTDAGGTVFFDLSTLPDAEYAGMLKELKDRIARQKREAEEEAARKVQKEKEEAEERERLRVEAARLAEVAAAERKAREAAEAAAKAEREAAAREAARLKAEADAREAAARAEARKAAEELARQKAEAESKAAAEAEAKRKAAAAPDKEKLIVLAEALKAYELPEMETDEGRERLAIIADQMQKLAAYIAKKANEL
jgi:hypothetical protein